MTINIRAIIEAFENRRAEKGVVPFRKSDLTAAHIDDVLKHISKEKGIPLPELHKQVDKWVKDKDIIELSKKSPILYETIAQNAIESAVFNMLEEHKVEVKASPKFSTTMFFKLVRHIQHDHKQFFPLHNWHDEKVLFSPVYILLPDATAEKKDPSLKSITTAAASPNGQFIFYKPFMQQLLDYGHLIGVKAKGAKYKSNGGEIPDAWSYIEFLIIHEFMHYTYADFHYQKKLKADPQIINWVGDFRSNYLLAKSGYTQLPMGLFSDHVNYDRQKNYKEMYDLVKSEFDKLTPEWQKKLAKILGELMDDHPEGLPTDEEGDPGGKGGEPSDDIFDKIDKAHDEVERKLKKAEENKEAPPKPDPNAKSEIGSNKTKHTTGDGQQFREFDWDKVKPTFSWTTLLSNFAKSASTSEDTYAKPNKRMSTSVHTAAQMGAAAVKPGELVTPSILKLAICVDSSGSMHGVLPRVYAELRRLLRMPSVAGSMTLVKYSDSYKGFLCDLKRNSYGELKDLSKPIGTVQKAGDIEHLFKLDYAGGTNFSAPLVSDLLSLHAKGYAIIILTDSDIIWDSNYSELERLLKGAGKDMGMIFDRKESFVEFAKKFKAVPKTVTYFA